MRTNTDTQAVQYCDTIAGRREPRRSVSVRHSVCAPCDMNALSDRRAVSGRPALNADMNRVLYSCWKKRRRRWKEQLWWKPSHVAEVFLCQRRWGGWRRKNEEEEWGMGCSASRPCIIEKGWGCWGVERTRGWVGMERFAGGGSMRRRFN